jgi:hypothetical protein
LEALFEEAIHDEKIFSFTKFYERFPTLVPDTCSIFSAAHVPGLGRANDSVKVTKNDIVRESTFQ